LTVEKKKTAARKIPKADKPRSKGGVMADIADSTGLTRKQVSSVFESLGNMIAQDLQKSGPQQFTLPGVAKFTVQRKPATKARKGINPF
jgi:nucleoid DNA-binding protein